MQQIGEGIKFKKEKIEPPEFYFGARIANKDLNGKKVWAMTCTNHVKATIENVDE